LKEYCESNLRTPRFPRIVSFDCVRILSNEDDENRIRLIS